MRIIHVPVIVAAEHITRVRQERYLTGGDVRGGIKTGGMMKLDSLFQQHPQDQEQRECNMSDNQEPTVSRGEGLRAEERRAVLREYYIENEEFQKVICVDEQCQRAVEPWYAEMHLRDKHKISKDLATRIANIIHEGGRFWNGSDQGIPKDGTGPQEGLPVFDGFQCGGCGEIKARSVQDVFDHWRFAGHEEAKGNMMKQVRLQSWGGGKGADQRLWIVNEGKCSGSKERVEEQVEDESKEIPDDITEESEGWCEKEGQEDREGGKGKESFDGWEGDCFGWRWREAEHAGWDEMAGDW
ncbi:hypothetical protein V500_10122, partial [Pseudogymnoascus sp. VKM F-4518 (FW-2643)]